MGEFAGEVCFGILDGPVDGCFECIREFTHLLTEAGEFLFAFGNGLFAVPDLVLKRFFPFGQLALEACFLLLVNVGLDLPFLLDVVVIFLLLAFPLVFSDSPPLLSAAPTCSFCSLSHLARSSFMNRSNSAFFSFCDAMRAARESASALIW